MECGLRGGLADFPHSDKTVSQDLAHLGVLFDQCKVELMQRIIRLILLLLVLSPCGYAQETKEVSVDFEDHGSVPPVSDWYTCLWKLDGRQTL